jgi:hypothetical protein
MLVPDFHMLVPNFREMLFKREGEDEAPREAPDEAATIVLYGVRDLVDDIADTQHWAANLHVRILATAGKRLSRRNANADIKVLPIERKCVCVGSGVAKVTESGSERIDIHQDPSGRDRVQLEV